MRSVSTRASYSLQKQIGYSKEKRRDFEVSFELHSNRPLSPRLQTMTEINYWLMKSEPEVYGIKHLQEERETIWGQLCADRAWYADYQDKTSRKIPLVRLPETERIDD